ncbi:MAG: hypothetical protein H7Y32_20725, partial [Chloroflexales bacterium]|nr:hypothetical protein [Chloroflexales bacterium]
MKAKSENNGEVQREHGDHSSRSRPSILRRAFSSAFGLQPSALFRALALALPVAFLALFFLYPLATILWLGLAGSGAGLAALADGYYWRVLWFTTWQAALSTALTLLAALPAAFVFARYTFPGKSLLRALAGVPFVLPTVVVAAAFGALLGPRGALNTLLQALLRLDQPPIQIGNTLALVLIAHVF